ncbi:MAG: S8/S53 family peptidase [Actinomycetota bacterium]|nr:S8/S53 family peptidase [Actinomycetota bacterium]
MPTGFVDREGRTPKESEMPLKAKLAFPDEPQRFPDDRDALVRKTERTEIQKQITHLAQFPNDKQRQRKVVDRLASGCQARGLPSFAELSTGTVPALALQEFVVRTVDFERADVQGVIKKFRLSDEPVDLLGREVIRLTLPPGGKFPAVNAAITTLPIVPNYLVPLGGWTKGKGGPEPTACRPELRPPGATRIQVAVIDTGLGGRTDGWLQGLTNPELDPQYPDPNMPTLGLAAGHGTFVAGIVQRVESSTDIRMYQGLDIDGVGDDIAVGVKIEQAAKDGAQIINLSLGTQTVDDKPPPGIEAGIRRAIEINENILIVCAAGNYGDTRRVWPAAFSLTFPKNVIAVAALNAQGEKPEPEWSTHGDWVRISTIGEGIVSTYVKGIEDPIVEDPPDEFPANAWAVWSGTSFAAPQIAGTVASICLTDKVEPTEAINTLKDRGTPIPGYGVGVEILPGT